MKKLFLILALLPLLVLGQGRQTSIFVADAEVWNGQTFPALLQLPVDYNTATSAKYPLLIFLHGTGEAGNINGTQLPNIYNSTTSGGPAYFIAHGSFPDSFQVGGTGAWNKFIILSPQAPGWSASGNQLMFMINDMISKYRVDTNRIYVTGLSAGGQGIVDYSAHIGTVPLHKAAAMVPMSMAESSGQGSANVIVGDSTRAWGFGSDPDDSHGVATHEEMNYMNIAKAGFSRYTNYAGGHCCWNNFYTPTYKETINGKSMNIYEWLLTISRGVPSSVPPVIPPVSCKRVISVTLVSATYKVTYDDGSSATYNQ